MMPFYLLTLEILHANLSNILSKFEIHFKSTRREDRSREKWGVYIHAELEKKRKKEKWNQFPSIS